MAVKPSVAIYSPGIGVPSETFIRRHIEDLAPGRTVVICDTILQPPAGNWSADCPIFCTSTRLHWASKLVRQNLTRGRLLPLIDPLLLFLKKHNVRIVLGEYMDHSLPIFRLLRGRGIEFFVHGHGNDLSTSLKNSEFRTGYLEYAHASGVITISEKSKTDLIAIGLPDHLIHVSHNGVNLPPEMTPKNLKSQFIHCVAVGRMTGKKAPFLVLESFRRAYEKYSNLRLDYIGSGPMLSMVIQYVKCFGLEDVVTLHGVKDSTFVQEMLSSADIFIQHSVVDPTNGDSEGFPVAILEGMAHGLPVVATRHAGIPEQVSHQETGILVEEGDVDGMATGILKIAKDRELRLRMGIAGRKRVLEEFTWEQNRDRLQAIMGLGQTIS